MIKTNIDENRDIWRDTNTSITQSTADLVKHDQLRDRIHTYLSNAPLNIEENEYCYVKVVNNHLEIGRAKITLEE